MRDASRGDDPAPRTTSGRSERAQDAPTGTFSGRAPGGDDHVPGRPSGSLRSTGGSPTDVADQPATGDGGVVALRALARARRRNRAAGVDVFEGFYQAYLTAFGCGVAVLLAGDAVGDQRADHAQVAAVVAHGPALIAVAITVVLAVAVRSGSRGGPLVLPAADVRHVLLAPVPRAAALRPAAVRQVRFSAFVGVLAGAGVGVLASHRLPGGVTTWAAVGAGTGALTGVASAGVGLLACGRRLRPWVGLLIGLGLGGWSAVDVVFKKASSPMALMGELALLPLRVRPVAFVVAAAAAALVVGGVLCVGGMSLEQAERRATLASQIRFALTLQDLRTVVLLRRQLTQEQSRPRPWVRLGPLAARHGLVWRRDIRGLTRWPAVRLVRMLVLGAAAGAALVGTWAGTTPLLLVAALALFLAGLEALEALAQDIDHPDLPSSTPVVRGELRLAHAPVAFVVMVVVSLTGWATAVVMALAGVFPLRLALAVGPVMLLPASLLGLVGAAASVVMEPPSSGGDLMPAEIAGVKMVLRAVWSPALVLLGLTPLLVARSAARHGLPAGPAAASATILPLMAGIAGLGWLRFREDVHDYLKANTKPPASDADAAAA